MVDGPCGVTDRIVPAAVIWTLVIRTFSRIFEVEWCVQAASANLDLSIEYGGGWTAGTRKTSFCHSLSIYNKNAAKFLGSRE